jgi:hypothetical protein
MSDERTTIEQRGLYYEEFDLDARYLHRQGAPSPRRTT